MPYIELPPWYTEDWDSADIENERVPGLVHVSGIARGPKWDRKPAKGQTGEEPVFTGYKGELLEGEVARAAAGWNANGPG